MSPPRKGTPASEADPEDVDADVEAEEAEAEDGDGDPDADLPPSFDKKMTPSPALAVIVGADPLPRVEVVKKLWEYIKEHGLQDPKNPRMINADSALRPIFGANQVSMFEMTMHVNKHLRDG